MSTHTTFLQSWAVLWDYLQENAAQERARLPGLSWWELAPGVDLSALAASQNQAPTLTCWMYQVAHFIALAKQDLARELALCAIRAPDAPDHEFLLEEYAEEKYTLYCPGKLPWSPRVRLAVVNVEEWAEGDEIRTEALRAAQYRYRENLTLIDTVRGDVGTRVASARHWVSHEEPEGVMLNAVAALLDGNELPGALSTGARVYGSRLTTGVFYEVRSGTQESFHKKLFIHRRAMAHHTHLVMAVRRVTAVLVRPRVLRSCNP